LCCQGPDILNFVCVHARLLCWWGCSWLKHNPISSTTNPTFPFTVAITCTLQPCTLTCARLTLQELILMLLLLHVCDLQQLLEQELLETIQNAHEWFQLLLSLLLLLLCPGSV
jgi:hypothetical protein